MLIVPTTFQLQRGLILAVIVMIAGIATMRGQWRAHRDIVFFSLLTVTASFLFMLRGAVADAPGERCGGL